MVNGGAGVMGEDRGGWCMMCRWCFRRRGSL